MKWICIKNFPEQDLKRSYWVKLSTFPKRGEIFAKWTYEIHLLSLLEGYNINEYVITLAEWRDKQIDSILVEQEIDGGNILNY